MPTYRVKLSDGRTFDVQADQPPSESDVLSHLSAATGAPAQVAHTTSASVTAPQGDQSVGRAAAYRGLADAAIHSLPTIGGLLGGLGGASVGGVPGGIGGATAGGALGEGARQAIERVRGNDVPHGMDIPKSIATQGAEQGAYQVAGEGVAAAGGVLAKWLMNRATTRVTSRLAEEFPELTDTLIANALTVSRGGYEKAKALLSAAKAPARAAIATAEAAGHTLPVELTPDVADSLKTALLEKAIQAKQVPVEAGTPISVATKRLPAKMQELFASIDKAADGGVMDLTPTQADLLKTQLQKESRSFYLNKIAPNGRKAMGMGSQELADYATQINSGLDALAPGYKAANAEAQPLIGAVRGLKQATRPSGNLLQAMVRPGVGAVMGAMAGEHEGGTPGAALGAMAGAAMTSPAGMSREAIILAHPVMQSLLKQMPRTVADRLSEFLQTHSPLPLEPETAAQGLGAK